MDTEGLSTPFGFVINHWIRPSQTWNVFGYIFFVVAALGCWLAPFTKVEESFNVQAIHDIVYFGLDWIPYDHRTFPSVVPRSCIAAIALAVPAKLVYWILSGAKYMGLLLPYNSKLFVLLASRLSLVYGVTASLCCLATSSRVLFGKRTSLLFMALTSVQYHLLFWSSRTLPNTMAFVLTNTGLACYCMSLVRIPNAKQYLKWAIALFAFAASALRSELIALSLSLLVVKTASDGWRSAAFIARWGVFFIIGSLLISVPVDTLFWTGRLPSLSNWRYPEFEVLWFNTVDNESHKWGTLPFHAYFTRFLPRILAVSLFGFVTSCFSLLSRSAILRFPMAHTLNKILLPSLLHVVLLSLLPHKEWRFIMYSIPIFTLAAAYVYSNLYEKWANRLFAKMFLLPASAAIYVVAVAASVAMIFVTMFNYPGGVALDYLHRVPGAAGSVHIDTYSAMNGVNLFVHYQFPSSSSTVGHLEYSKLENLTSGFEKFDYLVASSDLVFNSSWEAIAYVNGYSGVNIEVFKTYADSFLDKLFATNTLLPVLELGFEFVEALLSNPIKFVENGSILTTNSSLVFLNFIKLEPKVILLKRL